MRAALVKAVEKADEAIDRATARRDEAQRLLDEFDEAMEQQRKTELLAPRIDLTTGEVID